MLVMQDIVCIKKLLCCQVASQSIDAEDFEMRQLAWTCMAQLLQHDPSAVNSYAYSFVRYIALQCTCRIVSCLTSANIAC